MAGASISPLGVQARGARPGGPKPVAFGPMQTPRTPVVPLLCALFLAACAPRNAPDAKPLQALPPPTPAQAFARLVDDVFAAKMAYSPSSGTSNGLHEYDDRLEDFSRARIDARIGELKAQLERAEKLPRASLSFDDAIDAEALEGLLRGDLLDLETLRAWEKNPMVYAGLPGGAIDGLMKRAFAPAPARMKSVIARLRAVPAVYAAGKANLQNPPKEFTDLAIRMSKGSIGFFERDVVLWSKEALAADPSLKADFEAANAAAAAATREFSEWLVKDLLPRSKGAYAIGAETFLAKLKYDEQVALPLAELLAQGEAQLAKDHAAFVATAKKINPKQTPAQVMLALSKEHPTAEDLIPSVRRSVEAARQFLVDKALITLPSEVRPHIEETPPYARSGGFASMDSPGPFETNATEAFYYVTPVEKDWDAKHKEEHLRLFNPYVVAAINVHEAYPGHFVQFLYAPQFKTKTRKLLSVSSNAEGWAHYAEQMMVDEGFGKGDPKVRLAQLQEALLRDCRYVVGIKLHTEGWTVEQGAKLMVEKGFQEPANAYEESRRGAYNPTYLYYTLGKLEIYKLREEYLKKSQGTLRQFHDAFVSHGALPIPLVRKLMLEGK